MSVNQGSVVYTFYLYVGRGTQSILSNKNNSLTDQQYIKIS